MFFLPVWTIVNHLFFDRCRLVKAVSIFELWRNIFVLSLSFWFIDDHRWAKPQVAQVCPESLRKHVIDAIAFCYGRQSRKALREPNGRKSAWKIYKVQSYNHRSEMDTFYSMRVQIPKSKIEPFVPTKIGLIRSLLNVCNLFLVAWEKALIISAAGRAFLRPRELETSRALTMKTVATRILHLFVIKNCKIILYCFFLSIHQVRVFAWGYVRLRWRRWPG